MRSFRHLKPAEISEIISAHHAGVSQAELARRFSVDHSTIHYHLEKFERSYPEEGGVYAVLKAKVRKVCAHPSGRCNFCGEMWDGLMRQERTQIATLTRKLADAQSRLRIAGLPVE